jgi:hypothetical protein
VAETVHNVRKQQGLAETSPIQQLSPAGYQRRHGVKADVPASRYICAVSGRIAGSMDVFSLRAVLECLGGMIGLPAGTRIWIAAGVTDLRKGFTGLSGMGPTGDQTPPAMWLCYTSDRKVEHPKAHLNTFQGSAAGGWIRGVHAARKIQEAACRARVHTKSCGSAFKWPVATEALERIAGIYTRIRLTPVARKIWFTRRRCQEARGRSLALSACHHRRGYSQ